MANKVPIYAADCPNGWTYIGLLTNEGNDLPRFYIEGLPILLTDYSAERTAELYADGILNIDKAIKLFGDNHAKRIGKRDKYVLPSALERIGHIESDTISSPEQNK